MNRTGGIIIGAVVVLAIVLFVWWMKGHAPKYKWYTDYNKKSDQPYGLKCFYDLLKEQKGEVTLMNEESLYKLDTSKRNANFIMINSYMEIDSAEVVTLFDWAKKGNTVFISVEQAPMDLMARFVPQSDSIYGFDSYELNKIRVNFNSKDLPYKKPFGFEHKYLKDTTSTYWSGYSKKYFEEKLTTFDFIPISSFNDSVYNCFYVNEGEGKVIIHSNPLAFTNYFMVQKKGMHHANNIFSYLNNGPVYWNELGGLTTFNNNSGYQSNPLKFLFSHYTLKAGWYLFLASVLVFLIFRAKREQRIIPVVFKNKNTSIEYAKGIGSLFYQKKSHFNIGNELYMIFLADIRSRYNIVTSKNEKELIEQICVRTEIKREIITDLFAAFSDVKYNVNATAKELVKLYQAIENFNNLKK
jgi:hypothetical protein